MTLFKELKNLSNRVKIGQKFVGEGEPVFFTADIGANHNGDYFLAKKHIEEAAKSGVDAVKLQKRFVRETAAKELLSRVQTKDQIFGKTYEEYRDHLELGLDEYVKLKEFAESLGLVFFATPYDKKSVDFLEGVGVEVYKIASQDVTNLPLVEYIAKLGKPIIISSGASEWEEVDEAIHTILKYNRQLIIQYCISIYPVPEDQLNMSTLKLFLERYSPLPVGYSGHEKDILPSLMAVALGARIIERHFTLDKALPGPDHATVSLEPEEMAELVKNAKRLEIIHGQPVKKLLEGEVRFRHKHAKSLVSKVVIPAGTVFTAEMIVFKSPGYGLKPNMISKAIGKRAKVDIPEDTVITEDLIEW